MGQDSGNSGPANGAGPSVAAKTGISGMTKLAALAVAIVLMIGVPLGYLYMTADDGEDDTTPDVLTITVQGKQSQRNFTIADLKAMTTIEGQSSYQNSFMNWRGLGNYKGVELQDLADEVGGMSPGDIMTVTGEDGYWMNYSYYQVYPDSDGLSTQGRIMLAYEFNESEVIDWEQGPMVVVLAPDHAFSNEDLNLTVPRDPEFKRSTSGGSLWVQNVQRIKIVSYYTEWVLALTDLENEQKNITRTKFVSMEHWAPARYVDSTQRNWTGVNISDVLGLIDDDDPSTLNETLAATQYRINVSASDNFSAVLVAKDLVDGGAMLAYKLNGTILDSSSAPLRLTGPFLSGSDQVKKVAKIAMLEPEQAVLTVSGDTLINYTLTEMMEMASITSSGGYKKSSGAIEGPFEFTGVRVNDLVPQVYAGSNYTLQVEATDGYMTNYTANQSQFGIFKHYDSGGNYIGEGSFTLLLAYEQNATPLVGMDLRIAIVDESSPITDSMHWAKMVRYLRVMPVEPPPEEVVLTVTGDSTLEYTMSEVLGMASVTSTGGYMKSTGAIIGPNEFQGIEVKYLVSQVYGGMDFSLEVEASDGYIMTFSSSQAIDGAFAHYDMGGNLIGVDNFTFLLAYEQDGAPLYEGNFRIVIVGNDSPITDGHFWVKMVRYLRVVPFVQEWTLNLSGVTNMAMDRQTFEGLASCPWHTLNYTLTNSSGSYEYEGVALWILIAAVDGADAPDGHYLFNDALASYGYNVSVIASDGYNRTFTAAQVARNDSMIVAHRMNDSLLPDDQFPLRLVGENLTSGQMVKKIASIRIWDMSEIPLWNLTLIGNVTAVIDSQVYESTYACGVHAAHYYFTNGTGEHDYAGLPLWVLIGMVDDDEDGHWTLNMTLVALGYSVKLTALDGYNVTIPIADIAGNDTLVLAFLLDNATLTGTSWPLRLVGPGLSGSLGVKGVVQIELIGLPT